MDINKVAKIPLDRGQLFFVVKPSRKAKTQRNNQKGKDKLDFT